MVLIEAIFDYSNKFVVYRNTNKQDNVLSLICSAKISCVRKKKYLFSIQAFYINLIKFL